MTLPVAPLALLMALIPAAVLIAVACWRLTVLPSYTLVPAISLAAGVALVTLSAIVCVTYAFEFLWPIRDSFLALVAPLVGYFGALTIVGRKGKLVVPDLVIGGILGLVPVYFLGLYVMLLSACSFGDCV